MAETLLSPSNILLYGRVVDDLSIHEFSPRRSQSLAVHSTTRRRRQGA